MEALFGEYEGAIENTQKIADMCNFDFDFSHVYLPRFRPDTGETPEDYLKRLAYEGFEAQKRKCGNRLFRGKHRRGLPRPHRIRAFRHHQDGVCGILSHRCGFYPPRQEKRDSCRSRKRLRRRKPWSRTSVGITDVDSIKYHLMFERFLNPERVSMPTSTRISAMTDAARSSITVSENTGADPPCMRHHHLRNARRQGGHPRRRPACSA